MIILTTPQLWELGKRYEFPKTQTEELILKGIKAELAERESNLSIGDLKEQLEEAQSNYDDVKADLRSCERDNDELSAKVDKLEEQIANLKKQS